MNRRRFLGAAVGIFAAPTSAMAPVLSRPSGLMWGGESAESSFDRFQTVYRQEFMAGFDCSIALRDCLKDAVPTEWLAE